MENFSLRGRGGERERSISLPLSLSTHIWAAWKLIQVVSSVLIYRPFLHSSFCILSKNRQAQQTSFKFFHSKKIKFNLGVGGWMNYCFTFCAPQLCNACTPKFRLEILCTFCVLHITVNYFKFQTSKAHPFNISRKILNCIIITYQFQDQKLAAAATLAPSGTSKHHTLLYILCSIWSLAF